MESPQKPSIGRIVHFVGEHDGVHIAAIITAVHSDIEVSLTLFGPNGGMGFRLNVLQNEGIETPFAGNTWHWPERV